MSLHRSQAQFERAKWRPALLFVFWALQLLLTLGQAGLFAWRLGHSLETYKEKSDQGKLPKMDIVWESTNIGLSLIAAGCTVFEIARYILEALTPWTMLFTNVLKFVCAAAIMALDVVIYIQESEEHYSLIGLGIDGALLLTTIIVAVYSIRAYRRLSTLDHYPHTANAKPYGFSDRLERAPSYSSKAGLRSSLSKRLSSRMSSASARSEESEAVALDGPQRTPSYYSHERDTQFDDYLARRRSDYGQIEDMDRQRGLSPHRETVLSPGSDDGSPGKTRPSGRPRTTSYLSDHILVAVPEEEDDRVDQDRKALLGGGQRGSYGGPRVMQEADIAEPRWARDS